MPISVVINTYNASKHLAEVLETVKGFDEVLVCDMESTDNTLEIAGEFGCKVVTFPKGNHKIVEPARMFAIQSAKSEWVLVVDADELVTPELKEYLYKVAEQQNPPAGLYIKRRNRFLGKYCEDWSHDYQLRFFKRKDTEWPSTIHSVPIVKGEVKRAPVSCPLLHLADETMTEYLEKMNRYTDYEVIKKANRNYGVLALIYRPAWRFFRAYFIRGGFMMGKRGLIDAMLAAIYQYAIVAKIMEKNLRKKQVGIGRH